MRTITIPCPRDTEEGEQMKGCYGIFDTQDNCWIGNMKGPFLTDNHDLALYAANVMAVTSGANEIGRVEVRMYDGSGNSFKDEVPHRMSVAKAIRRLENGTVLAPVRPRR